MQTSIKSVLGIALAAAGLSVAADWPTDGGNPQRTAWQQDETILNKANVGNMKLLWSIKLDNVPREMHSLFPPVIAGQVKTTAGMKQIAVTAGSSDNLYAIDVAAGALIWSKHFDYKTKSPNN